MAYSHFCFSCMSDYQDTEHCPFCGYSNKNLPESELHLQPGTALDNKYLIGRSLGQGGFGITYLAWDQKLNLKLAIKEYLPTELAYRTSGRQEISVYKEDLLQYFQYGLEKYLEEARLLARFAGHPNIVWIRDYFEANRTAYIVMEYVEGVTIKDYLKLRQAPLKYKQALDIFLPVMEALREVHAAGILHRDISPDNMLLDKRNRVVLIDFGAARQAVGEKSGSLSVIMKPGFSPIEQYHRKGKQGPWTDIYALAATFYLAITGKVPPESLDRLNNDPLIKPSYLADDIPEHLENMLMKALAVKAEDRYQSVEEFQKALINTMPSSEEKPAIAKAQPITINKTALLFAIIIISAALITLSGFFLFPRSPLPEEISVSELKNIYKGNVSANIVNGGLATAQGDWHYFRSSDNGSIRRVSADGNRLEKLNDDDSWYINVVGDWLYYRSGNEGNYIVKTSIDGSESKVISQTEVWYVFLVDDWIYYRDKDKEDMLYRSSLDGSYQEIVLGQSAGWINIIGEWVFYVNLDDQSNIYRTRVEGNKNEKIGQDKTDWLCALGNWLYYRNLDDNGKIYRIKTDGSERYKVSDDRAAFINVDNEWIYYSNLDDDNKIYRIRQDGTGYEKVNDDNSTHINLVDDWIYYLNWSDGGNTYRILTDGTNRQIM